MDEEDEPKGATGPDPEGWMLSFGDLVSLMLVFFVMLFSMATLEKEEFEAIVSSLSQQFNPRHEIARPKPVLDRDIPKISQPQGFNLDYLVALLEEKVSQYPTLGKLRLHRLHDRLVISLPIDSYFEQNSVELRPQAQDAISLVGEQMRYISNYIEVNGHDDPDTLGVSEFPSKWELTLARAVAVANEMRRGGYDGQVPAFGYGSSRFDDLSLSVPAPERYQLARRVDIVIRRHGGDERSQ